MWCCGKESTPEDTETGTLETIEEEGTQAGNHKKYKQIPKAKSKKAKNDNGLDSKRKKKSKVKEMTSNSTVSTTISRMSSLSEDGT